MNITEALRRIFEQGIPATPKAKAAAEELHEPVATAMAKHNLDQDTLVQALGLVLKHLLTHPKDTGEDA